MAMIALPLDAGRGPTAPAASPSAPPAASPLPGRLAAATNFADVFSVVRDAVRTVLGIERPGLGLGLSDLPPNLGAYWPVTGNLIVMNEGLLAAMRAHTDDPAEYNSFVFVILAHEYLHALGYLDERGVRGVTARVARSVFGPDHFATRMAEGDLWRMFPFLQYAPRGEGRHLKVIGDFDRAATSSYIR